MYDTEQRWAPAKLHDLWMAAAANILVVIPFLKIGD